MHPPPIYQPMQSHSVSSTVHLTDALQCGLTKASTHIYPDIYFNIDNVVSSRPFFPPIKPNSRSLGLNAKMRSALEWVSVHLWSISALPLQWKRWPVKTSFHQHPKSDRWEHAEHSCSHASYSFSKFVVGCHLVLEVFSPAWALVVFILLQHLTWEFKVHLFYLFLFPFLLFSKHTLLILKSASV